MKIEDIKLVLKSAYVLVYLGLGFLFEVFILYLFPHRGDVTFFHAIISFFVALGAAVYVFIFLLKVRAWIIIPISFLILIAQFYFQLSILKYEYLSFNFGDNYYHHPDAMEQIEEAIEAYNNYDSMEYEDMPAYQFAHTAAFKYKFQHRLSKVNSLCSVGISRWENNSMNQYSYMLENVGGVFIGDTTEIKIIKNDTATIIIEYPDSPDQMVHVRDTDLVSIFSPKQWFDSERSIFVYQEDFKLETGFQELFYNILKFTKEPQRQVLGIGFAHTF